MMSSTIIGALTLLLWIFLPLRYCPAQSLFPDDISVSLDGDEMGDGNIAGGGLVESNCNMNCARSENSQKERIRIWLEEPKYDRVPEKFQAYACQEHLLQDGGTNVVHFLRTDLVIYIKNESDFELGVCKEEFSFGYYGLEMDIRVPTGEVYRVRRKEGVWTRNFLSYEYFKGERICRRLISLDRRLWDGMPDLNGYEHVDVRPRFAFFFFVKDGERNKSPRAIHANMKEPRWTKSRDGELVGEWVRLNSVPISTRSQR